MVRDIPRIDESEGDTGMSWLSRLQAAWTALIGEDDGPVNGGHRYGIVIGDICYEADVYRIDPYSGLPEWEYMDGKTRISCKRFDYWTLKDYGERA